jgi:Zn-dependent peptidase ImmA (M78 family)
MERVRINGRTYSDPDVVSLIRSSSHPIDPQREVVRKARELNQRLRNLGEVPEPRRRLEILASLAGIKVASMDGPGTGRNGREALIYRDSDGSRRAYYDPTNSEGRVNFSIAHEIVHTFFPNSANGGRFRSICADDSREANELEMLCHRGAAELLMPVEEFTEELNEEMGLAALPRLCERFGSSYEATTYRMATAYPRVAVAGLLRYRHRKEDARRLASIDQHLLFGEDDHRAIPLPKLRRQSLRLRSNRAFIAVGNNFRTTARRSVRSKPCERLFKGPKTILRTRMFFFSGGNRSVSFSYASLGNLDQQVDGLATRGCAGP